MSVTVADRATEWLYSTDGLQRLMQQSKDAAQQAKQAEREQALRELPKIEAQAKAEIEPITRELRQAEVEQRKTAAAWRAAQARVGNLQRKRALLSGRFDRERARAFAAVRAVVPQEISRFVEWVNAELKALEHVRVAEDDGEPTFHFWARFRGHEVRTRIGNGESIRRRGAALVDARVEAMRLADEPLTSEELTKRLEVLKAGIPQIEFGPAEV